MDQVITLVAGIFDGFYGSFNHLVDGLVTIASGLSS